MLVARLNFQTVQEIQPTISFALSHLDGKHRDELSYKAKNLKYYEIHYKATGHIALQLLSSSLEMTKHLFLSDMHVSYRRGSIVFQILSPMEEYQIEEYIQRKALYYFIHYSVNRKSKNSSLWFKNKDQINSGYVASSKTQRFVMALAKNHYAAKSLILN